METAGVQPLAEEAQIPGRMLSGAKSFAIFDKAIQDALEE